MAQQIIDTGTAPNNGTGDPLRTAFTKCNENFTELYDVVIAPSEISKGASKVTIPSEDGNILFWVNDTNSVVVTQDGISVSGDIGVLGDIVGENFLANGNISSVGNITSGNLLTAGLISASANINGGNLLTAGNVSAAGNITGGNVIGDEIITLGSLSAAGNVVTDGFIYGDGGFISNITVTSNVAVSRISNGNSAIEVAGSGANAIFTIGGSANVLVISTTGVFANGIVSATGNVTAGNLRTNGVVQASGNVTGSNIIGVNLFSTGIVSAIGNIFSSANVIATTFKGNVQSTTLSATSNVVGGDLLSLNDVSAAGNIIGNNLLLTGGLISSVGDITSGNLISTGFITAAGNITVGGIVSSTGNAIHGNLSVGTGTVRLGNVVNNNANGVGNIGSSSNYFDTVFAKATSAQYADLAEYYVADEPYEPGTVVKFGGDFEITLADRDLDPEIAGVISTSPAYAMNTEIEGVHTLAVALQGRVPCKIIGPVKKGQMMVSAGNGYARAENSPAIGTVIGKALEHFDGEQGVIEVVVGRV